MDSQCPKCGQDGAFIITLKNGNLSCLECLHEWQEQKTPFRATSGHNISSVTAVTGFCRRSVLSKTKELGLVPVTEKHRTVWSDGQVSILLAEKDKLLSIVYIDGKIIITARRIAEVRKISPAAVNEYGRHHPECSSLMSGKRWLDAEVYLQYLDQQQHFLDAERLRLNMQQSFPNFRGQVTLE